MRDRNEQDTGDANAAEKRLTVTYYVDPLHLRTVSIPVRRANALLVTLSATILWGVGTAAYFGYALYVLMSDDPASTPAVASVDAAIDQTAAPVASPEAAMPEVALPEVAMPAAKPDVQPVETAAVTPAPTTTGPAATSAADATIKPTRGRVVETKLARNGRNLNVRFAIVNHGGGAASGNVWGVAEFRAEDGTLHRIGSHPDVDPEAPEAAMNRHAGLTYKAKRRADKSLAFALPHDQEGRIESVAIFTSEGDGAAHSVTRISVQP